MRMICRSLSTWEQTPPIQSWWQTRFRLPRAGLRSRTIILRLLTAHQLKTTPSWWNDDEIRVANERTASPEHPPATEPNARGACSIRARLEPGGIGPDASRLGPAPVRSNRLWPGLLPEHRSYQRRSLRSPVWSFQRIGCENAERGDFGCIGCGRDHSHGNLWVRVSRRHGPNSELQFLSRVCQCGELRSSHNQCNLHTLDPLARRPFFDSSARTGDDADGPVAGPRTR